MEEALRQSPYGDDDFVYEGYKNVQRCQLYVNGTGCPEVNKCLNSHRYRWNESLKENKERCYVCGFKGTKRCPPHKSAFCSAPGGGEEFENIRERVENWIVKELPLRPGRVKPIIPPEEGRHRSKSPTRRRSQEREEVMYGQGLSAWDIGEEFESKRRQLMKALTTARKELTERL